MPMIHPSAGVWNSLRGRVAPGLEFLQRAKMLSKRVADQRRPILLRPACSAISGLQEFSVKNHLNGFHVLNPLHSVLHSVRFEVQVAGRWITMPHDV